MNKLRVFNILHKELITANKQLEALSKVLTITGALQEELSSINYVSRSITQMHPDGAVFLLDTMSILEIKLLIESISKDLLNIDNVDLESYLYNEEVTELINDILYFDVLSVLHVFKEELCKDLLLHKIINLNSKEYKCKSLLIAVIDIIKNTIEKTLLEKILNNPMRCIPEAV